MIEERKKEKPKYLIITADDFGVCHSVNEAIIKLLENKVISGATLMAPCSWAIEAGEWGRMHPEVSIGVHITLTSEWKNYKWGPVTRNKSVSTLTDKYGYFPERAEDLIGNVDEKELEEEIRNQILLVKKFGISPSHLDNHMGSLYYVNGRTYLHLLIDICAEYNIPLRLPRYLPQDVLKRMGQDAIDVHMKLVDMAKKKNVPIIDYLISYPYELKTCTSYNSFISMIINLLKNLKPGVSEIIIHPSVESDEIKAFNPTWEKRVWEFLVFKNELVKATIERENINIISYKDLRNLTI
ncbi:MAG: hypothetical protein CBR30_09215 [Dictyoglomus sp. NZ13-RE01]|nr:MAG: hypothetical protein CBR30_09215 [Dictyoglomus sp. NZ13-RE01]